MKFLRPNNAEKLFEYNHRYTFNLKDLEPPDDKY